MKRYAWPLAAVAVVAAGVSYSPEPQGSAPVPPIVWTAPHPYAPTWTEEAKPPAHAGELARAGLKWCAEEQGGHVEDVPLEALAEFTAVIASQTDRLLGLTLTSIAATESRFHQDVIACTRRGDNGAALGAFQMHIAVQHRPGDDAPSACAHPDEYVRTGLRWWRETENAWGNHLMHRARATAWAAAHP